MRFLGRWLGNSFSTALALVLGILAMQAPAFTRDYATALLQVATDARRDVDQREASARQFYGIDARGDDALIAALQPHEPSNAESLTRSLDRLRQLRQAYDDIAGQPALLQPVIALGGAIDDRGGYRQAIWQISLSRYNLQLELSLAAVVYGFGGVLLGSLIGQLMLLPFRDRAARHGLAR